jgi:hypothetical protein
MTIVGIAFAWSVDRTWQSQTIDRVTQEAEAASRQAARSRQWSLYYQAKMLELSKNVDWDTVGEAAELED